MVVRAPPVVKPVQVEEALRAIAPEIRHAAATAHETDRTKSNHWEFALNFWILRAEGEKLRKRRGAVTHVIKFRDRLVRVDFAELIELSC